MVDAVLQAAGAAESQSPSESSSPPYVTKTKAEDVMSVLSRSFPSVADGDSSMQIQDVRDEHGRVPR